MLDSRPAAKPLTWGKEEKFCNTFWGSTNEKNLFGSDLQLFSSSFVSMLTASWTVINFTEFQLVLHQPCCVSTDFVKWQWFINSVTLIWTESWEINLKPIQCFVRVSASFPHRPLSSCTITAGLHLLNPTSLKIHFISCPFTRSFSSVQSLWIQRDEYTEQCSNW